MAKTKLNDISSYIEPLYINGMQGRMLSVPAPKNKNREILFIYGHHSSLERWWGLVHDLNQYGKVTVPDLPGFGGMDSFYTIGRIPTIDNLADYLATFIKMRYKRKRLTIIGLSFGFVVITRMLQKYPELVNKVDLLISVVGFAHGEDFSFSKTRFKFYKNAARLFSHKYPAIFFRNVVLFPPLIRLAYARTHNAAQKFKGLDREQRKNTMKLEIHLWHCNDVRTHMKTSLEFLTLDNCKTTVDLPVWHISVKKDRYFNNAIVEQHMSVIFNKFNECISKMDSHAPSIIADIESSAPLIPRKIRLLLSKDPRL